MQQSLPSSMYDPYRLIKSERKGDVASTWILREPNLMLTLSSSKDQRKFSLSHLLLLVVHGPYV